MGMFSDGLDDIIIEHKKQLKAKDQENKRLRKYTEHQGDCRGSLRLHTNNPNEPCNCGLDDLLKEDK